MSVDVPTGREPPDLVRVSVVAGSRRSDLALPAYLPVAELVPGVARSLPAARAPDGFALLSATGTLDSARGLAEQEVVDGAVLRLVRVDSPGAAVHDDPAEAVAGAVDELFSRWRSTDGRRAAAVAAAVLTGLAAALALPIAVSGRGPGAVPFAALALGLVAAGAVLSRRRSGRWLPVGLVVCAAGYAAASAVDIVEPGAAALMVIAGGATVLTVGLVGVLALRQGAGLMVGLVVAGALLLAAGALVNATGVGFGALALAAVPGLLVADSVAPRLVLALTAPSVTDRALDDAADETAEEPDGLLDLDAVRADVRLAHDVLLGLMLGAGLLLWLAVPLLALSGPAGVALAAVACLVVLLRSRHHVVAGQVIARLAVGALGLAVLLSLYCWRHPDVAGNWLALLLPLTAGALVAAGRPTPWRWRLADVLEGVGVAAVLPLLALAAGVPDLVPRWLP